MTARRRIAVLGPFPPPVHGAAKNTRLISERLSASGASVTELRNNPVAPRLKSSTLSHYLRKVLVALAICIRLVLMRTRGDYTLYSVPDGGLGLYFNLFQYGLARLCGADITLHHRSYSHITTPKPAMRLLKSLICPRARHVFLSPSMAADFQAAYGFVHEAIVISNAATLDFAPLPVCSSTEVGKITIGYLSNLTEDKGFDVVADVMRRLSDCSDRYDFVLGGAPVNAHEQARLKQLQADLGERLDYQGPVYGNDKARFFAHCDVFLFPTRYKEEAQPNVLLEALAAGCIVLSTRRACIPDLLAGYEAELFEETEELSMAMVQAVEHLPAGAELMDRRQRNASRIRIDRDQAVEVLERFITALSADPEHRSAVL